jgi:photosystem II stability/assembly factor-like uncharacterized protein
LILAQNPWKPGELFFTLCRAVVQIRLARLDDDGQELLAYGRRLAQRLESVDCGGATAVPLLPEPLPGPPTPTPPPVLPINTTITATLRSFAFDPTEIGALAFADANHGWLAVGPRIYATDNGGATWALLAETDSAQQWEGQPGLLPEHGWASGLFFLDARHGWMANGHGGMIATEDGGATWNVDIQYEGILPGENELAITLRDPLFISQQIGFVIVRDRFAPQPLDALYRTDDGGKHWRQIYTAPVPESRPRKQHQLLDARTGFSASTDADVGAILRTDDAGATWAVVGLLDEPCDGARVAAVGALRFADLLRGWALVQCAGGTAPLFARSDDGGIHWVASAFPANTADPPAALAYVDPANGLVLTRAGALFATHDGGAQFAPVPTPIGALTAIEFTTPLRGWALHRKQLFSTTDGGQNWAPAPLGRRPAQLAATPDEQLWVITDEFTPGNTVQHLLTSRDGGAHWGEYRLGELLPSYGGAWHGRLSFADAQHGWLISTYGEVYYTQDGGASWTGW